MKFIVLFFMISTMLFASQKQIIIGSYSSEENAIKAEKKLKHLMSEDKNLAYLVKKNSLHTKSKPIDNYYVVSLLYINSYAGMLEVMAALKKYYKDAYMLDCEPRAEVVAELEEDSSSEDEVVDDAMGIFDDEPSSEEEPKGGVDTYGIDEREPEVNELILDPYGDREQKNIQLDDAEPRNILLQEAQEDILEIEEFATKEPKKDEFRVDESAVQEYISKITQKNPKCEEVRVEKQESKSHLFEYALVLIVLLSTIAAIGYTIIQRRKA